MSFSLNRAATAIAGVKAQVSVNLREVFPINEQYARIVAVASVDATAEQITSAFRAQHGHFQPVAGSFVSLASDGTKHVFEGIVAIQAERRVVTDEEIERDYKGLASNMFMSADEQLWTLKTTAGGKVMVKSTNEDDLAVMQSLMACASVDFNDFHFRDIASENANMRAMIQGGDLISYVSPNTHDLQMGIASVSLINEDRSDAYAIRVVRQDGQAEQINRDFIVAVAGDHQYEDMPDEPAVASAQIDYARAESYYAKVFARRPAYYQEFMRRFRAHAFH